MVSGETFPSISYGQGAGHRLARMIVLIQRHIEHGMDCITHKFIDHAAMGNDQEP